MIDNYSCHAKSYILQFQVLNRLSQSNALLASTEGLTIFHKKGIVFYGKYGKFLIFLEVNNQ